MYRLATNPGVSFGWVEGRVVFLDTGRDRYAALPADLERGFADIVALGGQVEPQAPTTRRLLDTGLFHLGTGSQMLRPLNRALPSHGLEHARRRLSAIDLAQVWRLVAEARRMVRTRPFASMFNDPAIDRHHLTAAKPIAALAELARRFNHARALVPIAPNCLSDSLALRHWLARRGHRCDLVVAARLEPFAAHCWIEAQGIVLNDTPERIATFVPIAVSQ